MGMAHPSLAEQVALLVPLQLGEVILGDWFCAPRASGTNGRIVLTNHRILGFRTRGWPRRELSSLVPEMTLRLEEIDSLDSIEVRQHSFSIGDKQFFCDNWNHRAIVQAIKEARLRRRADLGKRERPPGLGA